MSSESGQTPIFSTGGDSVVKKTRKNNNNNRNRNRNRDESKNGDAKKAGTPTPSDATEGSSESSAPSTEKKKKKLGKKSDNNSNNNNIPQVKPLFKELEKLLPVINPITINGLPTKNLTTDVLTFIKKVIDDKSNNDEIFMTFFMKPTDPDFPFDIELLTLTLCIPQTYPNRLPSPTIMILNDDIPRGYGVNIEIGFKKIVATVLENRQNKKKGVNPKVKEAEKKEKEKKGKDNKGKKGEEPVEEEEEEELDIDVVGGNDLLGMIKTLDKYLEKFLSMEKKDTIKLVKVINKQQQAASAKEAQKKAEKPQPKQQHSPSIDTEKYKKRKEELDILRQRLKDNSITVASDNAHGTTYKMVLYFKDDNLTVEFDDSEEVIIEKLYVKISVPKEYLTNPRKGIKLMVDMSNSYNIGLINSIEDTSVRLIFGKLINNISRNYDIFSLDIASTNCKDTNRESSTYWTITSQLNFFVHNIQKFMNEKGEFQQWYDANKEMNALMV